MVSIFIHTHAQDLCTYELAHMYARSQRITHASLNTYASSFCREPHTSVVRNLHTLIIGVSWRYWAVDEFSEVFSFWGRKNDYTAYMFIRIINVYAV